MEGAARIAPTQTRVVLDDAVVHDGGAAIRAELWVRVAVARLTVRRPACVADASDRGRQIPLDALHQRIEFPRSMCNVEGTVGVEEREPGGVVAAVLEAAETAENDLAGRALTGVADNAAHRDVLPTPPLVIQCTWERANGIAR